MDSKLESVKGILKKYGQEHLLLYYDKMDDDEKEKLLNQIENIDFELISNLYKKAQEPVSFKNENIEPIKHTDKTKMNNEEKEKYEEIGTEAIKSGKLAVVTMAGGQGTRLAHPGPKGTFIIDLENNKSIFEILCETLTAAWREYGVIIPWYIMTSSENNDATVNFFKTHNYFGYPKEKVHFFMQGELPMLDMNGKILLDENGDVKLAANGHGGTLESLKKEHILDEMKSDGIEWVYISAVDNILVKPVDPLLMGMAIDKGVEGACKSIDKTDPKERVGVICKKNGKVGVIEYTELPDEMANRRDDSGSLVFGDGNALFNLYSIKGLEKVADATLPYHIEIKKANYIDTEGRLVKAEKPNAYKFETFIFDSYEMFDDVVVLRVKREEEFAPIKNAEGQDSPETARKLYKDYFAKVEYMKKYNEWCTNIVFDEKTRQELLNIAGDDEEIKDRFYKDLEFGTGGIRGIVGSGTNRMNIYTVTKVTQGLANYILKQGREDEGVAIAYDSRNMSPEFAEASALTLNANGIKTYMFNSLRPTPELSFTVRTLGCVAGIVITASHNLPEYNGYKVYWDDGAQVINPHDTRIIEEVAKVRDYASVKKISQDEALKRKLYNKIGPAIDKMYIKEIEKQSLNKDIIKEMANDVTIVYTPLHGAGNVPVQTVLEDLGFKNVYVVPEQEMPNGNFPTVEYPNPEDKRTFELALKLAKKVDADVVLANDPDADRLGVYAKDKDGNYETFTGNMSALLIAEYVLSEKEKRGMIPTNGALVSTIVSSNLAKAIAKEYNLDFYETLTGFKYIGNKMTEFEKTAKNTYMFGFEESYGCLVGTHARDKDGIVAVMLLSEAAAFYKQQGLTLCDQMENIYKKYGYYKEDMFTITFKGADGVDKMAEIVDSLRQNPYKEIGGYKVLKFKDYKEKRIVDMETGEEKETDLPISNVLYFELERDAWCCMRPSGTEPKLKFYMGVKEDSCEEAEKNLKEIKREMEKLV